MAPAELALPGAWPRPLEGPDMVKGTSAEPSARGDTSWVAEYKPQRIDQDDWTAVCPFVVDCIEALGLAAGASSLRTVRVLARIAVWAVEEGMPLDVEVVLDPDTVERFATSGAAVGVSASTYRAVLRRVGPLLTDKAPWEHRGGGLARRQVAKPYSAVELAGLRSDALDQPTAGRIRAARALLALGAGAGLDGRWVARVRAADVERTRGGVLVAVGEPAARRVPVLADWEDEVVDLAASAGAEFLVGGRSQSRNRAGALAASLVVANGHPRFSASRLRSTWLVTHLAVSTRLPELARAAGLQGVTVLSDLLEFVPPLDVCEAAALLRGRR